MNTLIMDNDVTFEIKCWEHDYKVVTNPKYLEKLIKKCNYSFAQKRLIINNVQQREAVRLLADRLVDMNIIDEYVFVEDYIGEALSYFRLKKEDFTYGFYYSNSEIVGLYLCRTAFLFHFSSDSFFVHRNNFIRDSVRIMLGDNLFVCSSPLWTFSPKYYNQLTATHYKEFCYDVCFSDRCYLIKTNVFRLPTTFAFDTSRLSIYYPEYGGESFEKKLCAFLESCGYERFTYKKAPYVSKNIRNNRMYQSLYTKYKFIIHLWLKTFYIRLYILLKG